MKKLLMDEIAVVLKRFGDEQSTLLDQFERLSVEVQLNQAILGRSLSEPGIGCPRFHARLVNNGEGPPPLVTAQVKQRRRLRPGGSGFNKVLKKLLKPIFGRKEAKCCDAKQEVQAPDLKNPKSWKALSRSLRI